MAYFWHTVKEIKGVFFNQLSTVFAINGERTSRAPCSEVIKVQADGVTYYVKRYWRAGKYVRRFLGRSRIRAEWENLIIFSQLGIPTPELIAYGEHRRLGCFLRGALVTQAVENSCTLSELSAGSSTLFNNRYWWQKVSEKVADYSARLHASRFIHNDLKWRNILVTLDDEPQVLFFDAPLGKRKWGPFLTRGRIKDLACLDKVGRLALSRVQRLRFYLNYCEAERLSGKMKQDIARIVHFFDNRAD